MHTHGRGGHKGQPRILYYFRTAPNVRVGRSPIDEDAIRLLEKHNPDIEFDWTRILRATPPAQPAPEEKRERRKEPGRSKDRKGREPRQLQPPGTRATEATETEGTELLAIDRTDYIDQELATDRTDHTDQELATDRTDHTDQELATDHTDHADQQLATDHTDHADQELATDHTDHADQELATDLADQKDQTEAVDGADRALGDAPDADNGAPWELGVGSWELPAQPPEPTPDHTTPVVERLGSEGLARLRARYAEVMARIAERPLEEAAREQLKLQAERLNPDAWVTAAEVAEALEQYEAVFEGLRAVVGSGHRRRRRRR